MNGSAPRLSGFGYGGKNALWLLLGVWLLGAGMVRADDDLDVARAAFEDGLLPLAKARVERVLRREREDPEVLRSSMELLMAILVRQDEAQQISALLDRLPRGLHRERQAPWVRYWRAVAAFERGEHGAALVFLGEPLEEEDGEARVRRHELESSVRLALGETNAVLELHEQIDKEVAPGPRRLDNLISWARVLAATGDHAAVAVLLERLPLDAADDRRVARGLLLRAQSLERGAQQDAAVELLEALALSSATEPTRGEAWLRLSALRHAAGDVDTATSAAREALSLLKGGSLEVQARLNLGLILLDAPETREEGLGRLGDLVRLAPDEDAAEVAQMTLGDVLREEGEHQLAADAYRAYLERFAGSEREADALWGRGWCLLDLERFDEAAMQFRRSYERFEEGGRKRQALYKLGDALFAGGRYVDAADVYRMAFEDESDDGLASRAGLQAAKALQRAGQIAEAEALLEAVRRRYAGRDEAAKAGLRLGELVAERGALNAALAIFSDVAGEQTNAIWRARAWLGRGRVHYRAFRFTTALEDFERVVETGADASAEAAYLRAMSLYWLGRDDEALAACDAFLERYSDSPWRRDVVFWQGRHAYNRRQFERARERFVNFAERWPDEPWADTALLWAARAAFASDAYGDAMSLARRLIDLYPDSPRVSEVRFLQGETLTIQARFEEAILAFDDIIARFPHSDLAPAAWGRKGDCLFTLGKDNPERYEAAMQAYRVVAQRSDVPFDSALQAEFKIGRTLEKLERLDDALDQYYAHVMIRFLDARAAGTWHSDASKAWFARAAFQAADLLEAQEQWNQAIRLLERVVQAGVPGSEEARERIARIERESRWGLSTGAP